MQSRLCYEGGKKIRILLVKTSSLGDIIHTLPALTDAMRAIPGIIFDWVIEERFQAIPAWHPAVGRVIPIALRRWKKKKNFLTIFSSIKAFKKIVNQQSYDLVIDAQGLVKSALITYLVKAPSAGYSKNSIREKLASIFYDERYEVAKKQHAITRIRHLFSQALYYPLSDGVIDYGLTVSDCEDNSQSSAYVLFFHGTTWANKHWPENYWKRLLQLLNQRQFAVKLAWGNHEEYQRSLRIAEYGEADILPELSIEGMMPVIASAAAVVAVDTGLCHLAAALNVPTIALFGPTDPLKTGVLGDRHVNLATNFTCAPCLKRQCTYTEKTDEWPACMMTLPPQFVIKKMIEMNITH